MQTKEEGLEQTTEMQEFMDWCRKMGIQEELVKIVLKNTPDSTKWKQRLASLLEVERTWTE